MRFLKPALIAVAVLLVATVGAGAYLLSRIDEEALVREARSAVKSATGRTLDIEGKVDLRISFSPAIVAENVRFSNASWGSRPEMARVRRLEVELDLLPLIRGTVRIDRLVLIQPDVLLETDAKGRANWDFGAQAAVGEPGRPSPPAIEAGALRMRDGVLAYRDGKAGSTTRVEISALDFQEAAFGKLNPITMAGRVNGREFKLKGKLGRVHELLARDGTFPLDLEVTTDPARLSAKGKLVDVFGRGDAQLQVNFEAAEVRDLGALIDRRIPALGPLKARATIERDKGRVGMRDLDLALGRPGALHVSARGSIRDLLKPAGAALEFSGSAPESKHAPAFRASGRLEDFKDGVRVSGLKMTSGVNELTGVFEYRAGKARPEIVARLEGSSLDLAFLAATPDSAPSAAPPSGGPLFSREAVPLGRLREIDADARISLRALVLPNRITLHNFTAQLELRGGRLRAAPLKFVAGGGEASAELVVDASRDAARWNARVDGHRIVLGDLLAPTSLGDKIKGGSADIDVKVSTHGSSPHEWAAGLSGNVRLTVGEAQIKAREIHYGSDALTRILEAINPFRKTDPEFRLQCLVMNLPINAGVARSDRGAGAESDKMSVLSSGTIDLGKEVLDVNLRPRVKEGIGLGGAQLARLVRVTGPLTNPKLGLDMGGVVGTTASIAAGVATGGLSLLGEKLLSTATAENACKVALGPAGAQQSPSGATPERTVQPPVSEAPEAPAETKKSPGFLDRLFGN
jgi:hypothetical protein